MAQDRATRAYNRLAHFLWLLGIEAATGPAALSEMQDGPYRAHMLDYDMLSDDDDTVYYAVTPTGDARDLRACGCGWEFETMYDPEFNLWRACSAPLVSMLRKLGVIHGVGCVEIDNVGGNCGAW